MSFLLSLFFAVPVFSTMGLPLRWILFTFASTTGASLSWAPAVPGLFCVEVVSARLYPSHGTIDVTRVYVPRFFVSSQQRFGATDIKALGTSQLSGLGQTAFIALRQISVTALFYLEDSRRIHPRSVRACQPKDLKRKEWRSVWGREGEGKSACMRERKRERARFGSSFYMFFHHLGLPYAN